MIKVVIGHFKALSPTQTLLTTIITTTTTKTTTTAKTK